MRDARFLTTIAVGVAGLALGACADTAVTPFEHSPPRISLAFVEPTPSLTGELIMVCKVYRDAAGAEISGPDVSVAYSIERAGIPVTAGSVTIPSGECREVSRYGGSVDIEVSVTETVPAGYLSTVKVVQYDNGTTTTTGPIAGNTAKAIGRAVPPASAVIVFTNTVIPPPGGCTLTQGYWKTHSALGPAPYDANWENIGAAAQNTTFFNSGMTWYTVFWTSPAGGNAYLQLAHQYMAAKLNVLAGVSSTAAVDAAIASAEAYFSGAAAGIPSPSGALRATLRGYASTLGSYNEGAIGPGHCDD